MKERVVFSFLGRVRSVRFAIRGVRLVISSQHNAWVHLGATIGVVLAGFGFGLTRGEWCLIVMAIAGVWAAEALNTAVELLCDAVSPEFHPLVQKSKDAAAGAVLIAAAGALVVGILVFRGHLRGFASR